MTKNSKLTVEIDGKKLEFKPGQSIIEVADANGIYIPRFCYHKNLSVVANCRMCLVEVEKAPKALPACATPVSEGMVVKTKSKATRLAQKAVMEFLLINHPLDCPICDQGGECELQDVSMGYGATGSNFRQSKRAVKDEDLGPLISTVMTRCIHCTRCVRFGREIAGVSELGACGRGGHMEIGTYLKDGVKSELSGNMIDLCPVGALTSKPFKFKGRSWGFGQHKGVSMHDCIGTNLFVHVHNTNIGHESKVMRVLPRENDLINETWIADRDRFSYMGLDKNRISQPMVKRNGTWIEVDWQEALTIVAQKMEQAKAAPQECAMIMSPSIPTEEAYIANQWWNELGMAYSSHQIKLTDSRDYKFTGAPVSGVKMSEISDWNSLVLIGSNPKSQQPILGWNIRKSQLAGAKVTHLSSIRNALNYEADQIISHPYDWLSILMGQAKKSGVKLDKMWDDVPVNKQLALTVPSLWVLGEQITMHPQGSLIRYLVNEIAKKTKGKVLTLTEGANTLGCWLASDSLGAEGVSYPASELLSQEKGLYWLHQVHPEQDAQFGAHSQNSLDKAFVIATNSFWSEKMKQYADIVLPVSTYSEMSGTIVNVFGNVQKFQAAVMPYEAARPAWKVFRVLGNLAEFEGFDYQSIDDITSKINFDFTDKIGYDYQPVSVNYLEKDGVLQTAVTHPLSCDAIVRNSKPLQDTVTQSIISISPDTLKEIGIDPKVKAVSALQSGIKRTYELNVTDDVAYQCAELSGGYSQFLPDLMAKVTLEGIYND
tara:strand:+ start:16828 stop:19137 length:2310 start_codon:yes stop_codon:yes gene_type:complete